jgi:uncharacterized membrane protein
MPFSPTEYRSQTRRSNLPLLFWLGCVAIVLCVIGLIVGAPLAAASNHQQFAVTIYHSFKTLCHQLPERSFFIAGHQFAVCARCTGLYGGFALVLLLYPLIRSLHSTDVPKVKWLFLAAAPLAVDFSLTFSGIWENTHTSRLMTGTLLGGVMVLYVMPGILELAQRATRVHSQSKIEGTFTLVSPEAIAAAPSDYSAPQRRI